MLIDNGLVIDCLTHLCNVDVRNKCDYKAMDNHYRGCQYQRDRNSIYRTYRYQVYDDANRSYGSISSHTISILSDHTSWLYIARPAIRSTRAY